MYRYILSSILLSAILQPMPVQFYNAILPVRAAKPGLWMKMAVPHASVTNPLWSVHWSNVWYCKAYFRNWWLVRVAIFSGFDWVLGCQELCNVILHNRKRMSMPISTIDIIGTTAAHEKCGADPSDVKFNFPYFALHCKEFIHEIGTLKIRTNDLISCFTICAL